MPLPKLTIRDGQFIRNGERFVPFGPVYFARKPGTCGGDYFADEFWAETQAHVERDFARMAEIGCTFLVPFVKTTRFYQRGSPVEKRFQRFDWMLDVAHGNGLYLFPLPNCPESTFEDITGRPYVQGPEPLRRHTAIDPQTFDMKLQEMLIWAKRYGAQDAFMGMIDFHGAWRPVARRAAAYAKAATLPPRVSRDVLLLLPTPHLMGLDRIDSLTTAACLTSALARLGVAPEVKATYFRGREGIALEELLPFKMIVLGADEYRKDFASVPDALCDYVERGGRLLLALGQPDTLLSPTLEPLASPGLARLLGTPRVLATNHQHNTFWMQSLRWRLREDFLPYWDRRRGRWMPGRAEKRLTFKWIEPPADAKVLAEAVAPRPPPKGAHYGSAEFQFAGENVWHPLVYRRALGKGAVYVLTYSLNIFRLHLDEIDVQRDDWDWLLQAVIDDADVQTDPCHSLSVLAQEFLNFRPTR